ncbi:MAG: HDOD domain-containing protein [Candidatus Hydrogenedentes bacterium]|nr:HDOD domain-containing protein [Candidatus Hydrogenedentota bacterium]
MSHVAVDGGRLLIGERLIEEGMITPEQLEEALQQQKRSGTKIVATLIALGHLTQADFLKFLARQPGIASIHLSGYSIPAPVLQLVPAEFARKHEVVPMDTMGSVLTVGMAFPLDASVIRDLEALTKLRVKALLVVPEAIQVALDKYYPAPGVHSSGTKDWSVTASVPSTSTLREVAASLTIDGVMALVRGVSSLPAMPETVQRVQEAVANPDLGASDVAEILKRDPGLSAKIISLANAPVHGIRHRIDSIEAATAMLGLREVYTVAVAAAVVDRLASAPNFDYRAHWRRSGLCGSLAKILARASGINFGSGVYAAGLLHDIGRAVFAEVTPVPYGALQHQVPDEVLVEAEQNAFGISHPEVGYIVAENWALPAPIGACIRFHHQPERARDFPDLVRLVALASQLADHLEMPELVPLSRCTDSARTFGMEEHQLTGILDVARALRDSEAV